MFAVAGITGRTGAAAARTLLASGRRVRGLVRSGDEAASWASREGLELHVVPTLADADALACALEGTEGAYLLLPTDLRSESFLADSRRTEEAIARAVERSGVPHVVHLSSIGAHRAEGTGPIRALHEAELRLRATGARVTFLRAALFLENWAPLVAAARQGTLPTFVPPDLACPAVAANDIGQTAARVLLEGPEASPGVIELAGTREVSAHDVAGILARWLGRGVVAQQVPLEAVAPTLRGMGVSADLGALYRELYEGVANGTVAWQGQGTRSLRGTTPPEDALRALV